MNKAVHPIDYRLRELGKTRPWLAKKVGCTPQCIGQYCNRKRPLDLEGGLANHIRRVLGVDWNYLILGRVSTELKPEQDKAPGAGVKSQRRA